MLVWPRQAAREAELLEEKRRREEAARREKERLERELEEQEMEEARQLLEQTRRKKGGALVSTRARAALAAALLHCEPCASQRMRLGCGTACCSSHHARTASARHPHTCACTPSSLSLIAHSRPLSLPPLTPALSLPPSRSRPTGQGRREV